MLYLCGLNGEIAGCVMEIGTAGVTIGRDKGKCGFVIPRPEVSRVHAYLVPQTNAEGMVLSDLNSTNGTYALMGKANRLPTSWVRVPPREQVVLFANDRIGIGASGLEFELRRLTEVNWEYPAGLQNERMGEHLTVAAHYGGNGAVAVPLPMSGYVQQRVPRADLHNNQKKCPICNSTSLAAAKRGYSAGWGFVGLVFLGPLGLFAGAMGKDDIFVHCMNCGKEWKP